ncbi:response regulator [Paenibacillus sp. S150]|uniref:response regulator n=1 Tax=Paenibacillus sp. S150 TaxID=2749826 RepID=UPI001C5821C9|nr:response regulator [Paenibacillus sp. S150]MBW4082779.1 response regulator [Paenibacillus sp. S150]
MLKVMLVDDEPWVLEGLRTMVEWARYGFEVCGEALNGPDALRMIQELRPDLVLTDINIPVLNGLELITALNEVMAKPPRFVILSGYDDFDYAKTALRQRVDQYLLKPVDDEEIGILLSELSQQIRNEIASEKERAKKQACIVSHLLVRFIHGEYSEELQRLSKGVLHLEQDAELVCILIAAAAFNIDADRQPDTGFPWELGYAFQDEAGRAGMIVQSAKLSSEALEEAVGLLQRELAEQLQEPVTVMVSDRLTGVQSIREGYLQTLEVWKLKHRRERGGIYHYSDLKQCRPDKGSHEEGFAELVNKVKAGETAKLQFCVREAFAEFAGKLLTVEEVQAKVAHLEMTLCRHIAEMNGDPDPMMGRLQAEYGSLGELGDYFLLSGYVDRLCMDSAAYLAELKQANEGNTIFNVIQYVDLEFRGKLRLQDLARKFHMNSTYLGQLFRKETGRSFSEYVNEKRIEAAKGLLKRTQLKISDIAQQVGFSNTDYFIDKFKGMVGVPPSVYKHADKDKQL